MDGSRESRACRYGPTPRSSALRRPNLIPQVAGEAHVRDWKYLPDLRHDGGEQVLRRRPMRGERSDAPQRRLFLGQPGHASPAWSTISIGSETSETGTFERRA